MAPRIAPPKPAAPRRVRLLIATRKGLWTLTGDATRRDGSSRAQHFLGHIVHHAALDPRDGKTLLVAARTGHLGPTVFRSTDAGRSWKEAAKPPAFEPDSGRVVDHTFWLAPGHASQPGVWWAGTSPQGLFRSSDGGATFEGVAGFNAHPQRKAWCGGDQDGTPDGPKLHSILIDPRDAMHMYISMSSGGTFESNDGGADWHPLNQGVRADFQPNPDIEFGHDPHCVRFAAAIPTGCISRITAVFSGSTGRPRAGRTSVPACRSRSATWDFPMVTHPHDDNTAWIFPMDGTSVWPRMSPGGKPAAYRTRDAGKTWKRQADGLPKSQGWWTVKRQAMTADAFPTVGVYFGTTSGEVWGSRDEGRTWKWLAAHLPHIYAVESA